MAAMLGGGAMPPTTEVRRRGVAMASRLSRSKRRWQPAGQGLDLFVIFENDSNDVDPSSPNPRTTAHCLVRREAQRDPEASASVEPNLLARQQHPMSSTTVADASDASAAGGESAADGSTPAYSPTHGQRAQRELPSAASPAAALELELRGEDSYGGAVGTTLLAIGDLIASLETRDPGLSSRLKSGVAEALEHAAPAVSPRTAGTPRERSGSSPVCGSARRAKAEAKEKVESAKKRAADYVSSIDAERVAPVVAGLTRAPAAGLGGVIVQLDAVPWEDIEAGGTKTDGAMSPPKTMPRTGKTRRPKAVAVDEKKPRCSACPDQHFASDFWQRGRWRPDLLDYDSLPEWRKAQANSLIRRGYRHEARSYKECLRSWLYLHNESFNIHSHLWPAVATLPIAAMTMTNDMHERGAPLSDTLYCLPFFLGAFGCLFMSAMFHTMYECCESSGSCWSKLDYLGITLLIYGSMWPLMHFMFYCKPEFQFIYLGVITVLCIPTCLVTLMERYAGEEYKGLRAGLFSALGLIAAAPVIQFGMVPGLPLSDEAYWQFLVRMFTMGACYLFGALLYALSAPERFCVGKLDYFGNAHNIFHVLVLAGVVLTYLAFSTLFDEVELGGFDQLCEAPGVLDTGAGTR